MASGTINGSTGNEYIDSKIEWSSTANNSANTSSVTAALYYKRNNTGFTTHGTGAFSITINGVKTSASKTLTITENAWVKAVEATVTVSHNSDGTKSVSISASGSISGTSLSSTTCSGTATLETIPRASTITSASNVTLGGKCSVKWTPLSKSFRYKLKFALNGWSYTTGAIHPNQTSAYTYTGYTIPLEVANELTSSKTGTMTVTLTTFSDSSASKKVGSASSKTFTVTVPNNTSTQPSVSMSLTPISSLGSTFSSLYIQGKSKVEATLSATGKYEADIKAYNIYVGGKTYGSPYQSEYLTTAGTVTVKGRATDTRGYYAEVTEDVTVIPYTKPRIKAEVDRCDASGNISDSGTYLKISAERSYSPVMSGGKQYNFCQIQYRYKVEGGSYSSWTTILASKSLGSNEVVTGALLGNLSVQSTYLVQVRAIDDIGEYAYTTIPIPTDKVYMHRAGSIRSLGIGKYAEEENTFDIAEDITAKFRGDVQFLGEAWLPRALGTGVVESSVNSGRWGGTGVYYRVCAGGKHIYVAFNVSFTTSASTVRAESETIPYPPDYDVYALCAVGFEDGSRGIATVSVSPRGRVNIYAVHKLPNATLSTGDTVKWIDGYIDYWT